MVKEKENNVLTLVRAGGDALDVELLHDDKQDGDGDRHQHTACTEERKVIVDQRLLHRQVLESDPESVMQLFTDSEEGIFTKINNIMDDTAKISSGSPGALVELAGVKGKASESNNTLYEQIKDIDDRIAALKETYEREKNRYWSEFNTMEQLISNMNVQSSWLSQQFSSM